MHLANWFAVILGFSDNSYMFRLKKNYQSDESYSDPLSTDFVLFFIFFISEKGKKVRTGL